MITRHTQDYRWEAVELLPYKTDDALFKDITRQILCHGQEDIPCQLRYFEIAPAGYSTLERHEHTHLVMILRGAGEALLGDVVVRVQERDVLTIPPFTWHQFRANQGAYLGFLCLVNQERDKPRLPTAEDLEALRHIPGVADFIRTANTVNDSKEVSA
jgi:quercetin dioxygenase-like cupin family protein